MSYQNKFFTYISILSITLLLCTSCSTKMDKIPITTNSQVAKELYIKGLSLADRLRGQEASTYFEEAIALDSNFAMAYIGLALSQQIPSDLFTNLEKAISLKEQVSKGEQIWINAFEAQMNNQTDKIHSLLEELLKLYPNDERVYNFIATTYFSTQQYQESIKYYLKALEINPNYSPVYNQLGYAYRFLQNYNESEKMFQKYIQLIPNDPNPYDSYGELLLQIGEFDKSIVNYEKALQVNPYFTFSYLGIASNLNYKNEHVQARNRLQELLQSAKNDNQKRIAYEGMVVSYIDEGNLTAALKMSDIMRQLAIDASDTITMANEYSNLGLLYIEMEKPAEAKKCFENSKELIQKSSLSIQIKQNAIKNILVNFAMVDIKNKDFIGAHKKAEEYFNFAKEQNNPNLVRTANRLFGIIDMEEGNYESAIEYLRKSNQNDPYNIYRIALIYEQIGDPERALSYFSKAADANLVSNRNYSYIRIKAREKSQ